jgi:antitoxin MazE
MHVAKWGNSLAVRLPKALVKELGLAVGDELDLVAAAGRRLEVEKSDKRKKALRRMQERGWELPPGYKFDRDEANAR